MGKALMAGIILLAATFSEVEAADVQKLLRDTQRTSQAAGELTLVWWMPQAFWEASLNASPALTSEGRQQILTVLDDYMIFAILRAKLANMGALDARSKSEMITNARLEANGTKIDPIPAEDIAPRAQAILVAIKPLFAGMLGKFGQSVEMVVYPGNQDGRRIVDAAQKGSLQYTLYDQTFTWQLPLPSLLPVKVDPKTGAEFPGDYEFNPYTGTPLVTK
jgi:hypothetical protein